MRGGLVVSTFALVLGGIAACQGEDPDLDSDPSRTPDGGAMPDGTSTADGSASTDDGGGDASDEASSRVDAEADVEAGGPTGPGFDVVSPTITLDPGQETSTCYYFHTSNAVDLAIKSWSSKQGAGISHMALVFSDTDKGAPGTISPTDCTMFGVAGASWVYSAWSASAGWSFPANDGSGKPVGKPVKANQPAYLVIQMQNGTAATLASHVELHAAAYDPGTAVTAAEPYVAYNANVNVPAMSTNVTASETCPLPAGAKLPWLTMFAHRRAAKTSVAETGGAVVFQSTDFSSPGAKTWATAPFYTFPGDAAVYTCTYDNGTALSFAAGPDPKSDETCAMLAYHFPATKPRFCLTSTLLP